MKTRMLTARFLAASALVAAPALFAGCFAAPDAGEDVEDPTDATETPEWGEAELEAKFGSGCSPACGLKETCTSGNCCVPPEQPFEECQVNPGGTMTVDAGEWNGWSSGILYGTPACDMAGVNVVPGDSNWKRIEALTHFSNWTECECRAQDLMLKVRGPYQQWYCTVGGCYPVVVPEHEETVQVKGKWDAAEQSCSMRATVNRVASPASGPAPRFVGPVVVQAEATQRGLWDLAFYIRAIEE